MAESDSRTQILIACISLVGVIATALIANWRTLFPNAANSQNTAPHTVTAQQSAPEKAAQHKVAPEPRQPAERTLGDESDAIVILSAAPPPGSILQAGQLTNFIVAFRYRLTSLQSATLNAEIVQFDDSPSCSGNGHIPAAKQVPMQQGEHTVSVEIPYTVGVSKTTVAKGSIGFGASVWSDIANRKLFRTFPLSGYCYVFK